MKTVRINKTSAEVNDLNLDLEKIMKRFPKKNISNLKRIRITWGKNLVNIPKGDIMTNK